MSSVKSYFASDMDVFMGLSTSYYEGFLGVTAQFIDLHSGLGPIELYIKSQIVPYCLLFNVGRISATWLINPTWVIHKVSKSLHRPGVDFSKRLKLSQLSLCIRFKPQNMLKSVSEIGPSIGKVFV